MRVGRKLDARGDFGGMQRCCRKVGMQRLCRIELRDRQRPDKIVEVARVTLSNWLQYLNA